MPIIQSVPFRSPWNPIDFPGPGPAPMPSYPMGYGLTPADVGAGDWSAEVAGLPGTTPLASDAVAAMADQGAAQNAAATASGSTAASGGGALAVPPALNRNGVLVPSLADLIEDRKYGWDHQADRLFRRYAESLKVLERIRATNLPDPAAMPAEGTRLSEKGSFLLAAATPSGAYVVLTYRVPPGYYGYINYASNEYTGGGFAEAAGGLLWSIQVQQWFPLSYGVIPYTMGSRLTGLWNIAGGIPLLQNQYVYYVVTYDSTSTVAPGGYVICNLQGWIAPIRRREQHGTVRG